MEKLDFLGKTAVRGSVDSPCLHISIYQFIPSQFNLSDSVIDGQVP